MEKRSQGAIPTPNRTSTLQLYSSGVLGGDAHSAGIVYSTGCGPIRERQSAAVLLFPSLYLKVTSNSDKAKVHLISLALPGKA